MPAVQKQRSDEQRELENLKQHSQDILAENKGLYKKQQALLRLVAAQEQHLCLVTNVQVSSLLSNAVSFARNASVNT